MHSCGASGQYFQTSSITYIKMVRTRVWCGLLTAVDVDCDMVRGDVVRVPICVQPILVLCICGVCLWVCIVVVVVR